MMSLCTIWTSKFVYNIDNYVQYRQVSLYTIYTTNYVQYGPVSLSTV